MTDPLAAPPSDIQRVVYLGTPDVSAVTLRALAAAGFEIPLVVTRPDRRRGRGSTLSPSPVKQAAIELGLAVTDQLADVADVDADIGVVVAYGRIIPASLLQRLAMVNIHFSLLPRWRGAAPVERSLLAGDERTGVCLMEVAEGLDEGGVYARAEVDIDENETATELRDRLAIVGSELLVNTLRTGLPEPTPQVGEVTYAAKLDKAEARLDFSRTAIELHRTVRVGGAWAEFRGKRLGIEETRVHDGAGIPGALDHLLVATPRGRLELVTVKPEGKRSMAAGDWYNGFQPDAGECLV